MTYHCPYKPDQDYDDGLKFLCRAAGKECNTQDNDCLIVIFGKPGCGKSTWMLHANEEYCKDKASIESIALNRKHFANSVKIVSTQTQPRFLAYDEANVNKRDALSKWNKKLINLYFSIRGKNIFHIWCNPSIEMLDKPFIDERLKGVVYIRGANKYVRFYYYFKTTKILEILEKYKNLKPRTIDKVREQYASFKGWFKKYNGKLKEAYKGLKDTKMDETIDEFTEEFGDEPENKIEGLCINEICKKYLVGHITTTKYFRLLIARGVFKEGEHFTRGITKGIFIKEQYIPILIETMRNKGKLDVKI